MPFIRLRSILISLSFSKDTFTKHRILGRLPTTFWPPWFLVFGFLMGNQLFIILRIPIHDESLFLLSLLIFGFGCCGYDASRWGTLNLPYLDFVEFLVCGGECFFIQYGMFGVIISSNISGDLPSSSPIPSSACTNKLLRPPSDFFPSVWVTLFNFMTFFLVSFYNFFPHWLPLCETPFPYCHLDMTSFSPLYIFKIADLKYLSSNSGFWASSGTVSVNCFPLPWYFLMVSLYVSKFLSKTGHSKEYNVAALEMRFCPLIGFVTVAA